MFDALPEAFGSYRVLEEIGPGRFGPLYRAVQEGTGHLAAVKVFDQGFTPEQADRVAAALGRLAQTPLQHPAIAPVLAAGAVDGRAWLAEPWLEATPLDALMRNGPTLPAETVFRVTQVAGALDFAAAVGVHHGALHPRDILVSGDEVVLVGLGVIQALGDAGLLVPMEGAYVSPQRARGLPVTRQDDVFSLAAVTFELMYRSPVPPRSELPAAVPGRSGVDGERLSEALYRALSPQPDDRPSTALELASAVHAALSPIPIQDSIPIPTIGDAEPSDALPASEAVIREADPGPGAGDLPLREKHPSAEAPVWTPPSEDRDARPAPGLEATFQSASKSELATRRSASPPESSYWLPISATLAIGLLMGFASGYVVGQREGTPAPHAAERPVARGQRSGAPAAPRPGEAPAPTGGRDFTESDVAPDVVEERPVKPPPETSETTPRPAPRARQELPADPSAPGVLQVDSRPPGARVFVDGRLVGTTPLVLAEVAPGTHAVRIDLSGHRRWATSVEVAPGARQRVAASLER